MLLEVFHVDAWNVIVGLMGSWTPGSEVLVLHHAKCMLMPKTGTRTSAREEILLTTLSD